MDQDQPLDLRDHADMLAAQSAAVVQRARALRAASRRWRERHPRPYIAGYRAELLSRYTMSAD
jgi:hypothetical protein